MSIVWIDVISPALDFYKSCCVLSAARHLRGNREHHNIHHCGEQQPKPGNFCKCFNDFQSFSVASFLNEKVINYKCDNSFYCILATFIVLSSRKGKLTQYSFICFIITHFETQCWYFRGMVLSVDNKYNIEEK